MFCVIFLSIAMWLSLSNRIFTLFILLISISYCNGVTQECEECRFAVELLHDTWGDLFFGECIADAAQFICSAFHIEDHYVCKGIVGVFKDEFIYVLQQIIVEPHELCGVFLKDCGDATNPLVSTWMLPMPENKPPFKAKVPVPDGQPTLRVLHLTDIHLDMHYTQGLETDCKEPQCCRPQQSPDELSVDGTVKNPAGYWGMVGNCDLPYWTFLNMLQFASTNHKDLDYVLVTGDLMSHTDWDYNNVTHIAIIHNVSDTIRSYFPNIPVYFCVGNHEGVPIDNMAPHFTPQKDHMDWLYGAMADAWKGWYPADQTASVKYNGCYMKKLWPGLRLISINTVMGDALNFWLYINQTDPDGTMTWLIDQLYAAEADGDLVHIVAHIPGGDGEALEGWSINYYNVANRFHNTIAAQFFGHTHSEQFMMTYADPEDATSLPTSVVYAAPSATPYNQFYPTYRIYTIDGNYPGSSYQVKDFEEWIFNLTENNANPSNPHWKQLFSSINQVYGLKSQIPSEWNNMIQRMRTDDDLFEKYRENYYRRNQYDGIGKCDAHCKRDWLCSCQSLHHSKKLCSNLEEFIPLEKPVKYHKNPKWTSLSKIELKRKAMEWGKNRNSQTCPI